MDETRRFLRYVVPALVFVTELALLLLVTQQGWLIDKVFTELRNSGAGFAALLLAVAGGWGTCLASYTIPLLVLQEVWNRLQRVREGSSRPRVAQVSNLWTEERRGESV